MKIVYLVTGSGGTFYCTNCYRDMLFFRAVRQYGNADAEAEAEAEAVPLYLPPEKIYADSGFGTDVFFGAVSLFIREKIHALENMPAFLEKILDSPPLLKIAAKSAGSTRSSGLEEMTLSMIDSSSGKHRRELERLALHLKEIKADIIHLSNALIIGLAKQLRDLAGVKVVCSLQNEDDWINEMAEPYQSKAWELIGRESENVDAFIAPGTYFRDFIVEKTGIDREKIYIVQPGIEPVVPSYDFKNTGRFAIGFLSRVSYNNGFDKLIDAFIMIKEEKEFENVALHVCGGYTGDDKPFIKKQINKINNSGLMEYVRFFPGFHDQDKAGFLGSINLLSVPVRKPDGYGLYIAEANSAGIPVIQPSTGAFPEILMTTGGGILYEPDTVEELAACLKTMIRDKQKTKLLGETGMINVNEKMTVKKMAEGLMQVYHRL